MDELWPTSPKTRMRGVKVDMKKSLFFFVLVLACCVVLTGSIKMYAAGTVTVKGEIIETFCYAAMGAKGESHRQCGIDCVKAGIPAGILEAGTGKLYVLIPNKDKTGLPPGVLDKMGRTATITGTVYTSGGSQLLAVDSVK